MTKLQIEVPPKLIPVFLGQTDVRGAWGGRGSAKTRTFAKQIAIRGRVFAEAGVSGLLVCGREYMNSLAESSFAEVKAAIQAEPWLDEFYECGEKYIRSKCGRISFEFCGLRHNLASVKSKARILILWVDEAESVTDSAWLIVEPTIREEGSELWVTWNPEEETSATNIRFREKADPSWKIVEMNWRDNPWFPGKLERLRQRYKQEYPDDYDWVWEGAFRTHYRGAYFSTHLSAAKAEGRIGRVAREPTMAIRTYHDLGGSSQRADAYAIWVVQFINREIRVLDHYETSGQDPTFHINWLKEWCISRNIPRCFVTLPHDGSQVQINQSWEGIWRNAGDDKLKFQVDSIPNQGAGAAMIRVRAAQMHFPKIWFNEDTTKNGRRILAAYHEKWDENLKRGLGPNHNWASHSADAFGLMACDYADTKAEQPKVRDYEFRAPKQSAGWAW